MSVYLDALRLALEHARQHELAEARAAIQRARDASDATNFEGRSASILELNRALLEAKRAREEIVRSLRAIDGLDDVEREHVLVAPTVAVLDEQIAQLQARKSRWSRPA